MLSGRLLSEFLVALGLLFLALTANLAILHSASKSSGDAARVNRALELARDGLESLIAQPGSLAAERRFGGDTKHDGQTSYLRKSRLIALSGELSGLARAIVEVEWNNGGRTQRVRLERYVRKT